MTTLPYTAIDSRMTLCELAWELTVSPPFLSQIENSGSQRSVATPSSIAQTRHVLTDHLGGGNDADARAGLASAEVEATTGAENFVPHRGRGLWSIHLDRS